MPLLNAPTNEDVKLRLRPFGIFFEKSLKDLIKGIRSNNETPEKLQQFLAQALSECREEANSSDFTLKTNAVLKLTYLEMYGFDMSWANFHILEVMSSSKLQQKRVGYLAASQSFYKDPDILMLATNLMKKDLKYTGANDVVKVGIALSGLSTIITPSLASDICDDLFSMLNSTKPYIRKKAITALFKVFLQYPEALRDNFDNFAARLEDDDISVVSAAVSVICELSKKNPQPFIQLSPLLYDILVTISNNWIIIRLLKLFTNLSKVEPKLRPRLLPKILELMDSTTATSVLYESINCIVRGNMLEEGDHEVAMQCLDRLHTFCDSSDPNLRFISCVLFYKIGKINTAFISQFDKLVMRLLNDVDVSIRSKAIELIEGIVDENNLQKIVLVLLKQFVDEDVVVLQTGGHEATKEIPIFIPEQYKIKMVNSVVHICSMDNFANITDFEWYNAVLWDLAILCQDLSDKNLGYKIGEQLQSIMIKVPSMREITMTTIIKVLYSDELNTHLPGILRDSFWALGEYSSYIENGDDLIRLVLKRKQYYPANVNVVLIPTLLKIFSSWCNRPVELGRENVKKVLVDLLTHLEPLCYSKAFEVQERAVQAVEFLKLALEAMEQDTDGLPLLLTDVLPSFFNGFELKPISHGTQQKLQPNITLDCETPFLTEEELQSILNQEEQENNEILLSDDLLSVGSKSDNEQVHSDSSAEENDVMEQSPLDNTELDLRRKEERESNPFYLSREEDYTGKQNSHLLGSIGKEDNESENNMIRVNRDNDPENHMIRLNRDVDAVEKDNAGITKSRKKTKKRVHVLSDEVLMDDNPKSPSPSVRSLSTTASSARGKISLRVPTKLENFDFSKPTLSSQNESSEWKSEEVSEEQLELEKLRQKFEKQSLTINEAATGNDGDTVIVKKKKKKSNKKKGKHSADKKSNKVDESESSKDRKENSLNTLL
ncbi:related to AP-3 complex subunit delta [Zygosaccharomyces bailii]|nr:related to AP-3 complex subunit delta [Zygosaccharomyces bailii]